ncbi:unnamed protein product [Ceutorhynchus assimilis]|uniref:CCHC-type domain-containing protein n=1 Tax=Ceutorhynchus assimilis TaxID=467358 RepID=A0A9N9MKW8_9CUCU|nr:unnamed protein product [Ceutorhynchus assimilis]
MASPPGGEGTSAQTQINSSEKAVETMDGDFGDISTDKTQTKKCFNTFTDKYNLSCIYVMIENTSKENFGRVHPLRVGHILHKKLMIQNIIEVKAVGKNRVRVQLKSLKDANLLINNVALEKENLRAFIPNHLLETKGLIRGVDTFFEESYILQNINSSSKVTEIKRFTKKVYKEDSSFIVKKQTVLITFEGNILPAEVSIDTVFFPVEMYYGKVTQCFKCLSYGHISKQCKSNKHLCVSCGKDKNEDTEHSCTAVDIHCVHCKTGTHKSYSKNCPFFEKQKSLKKIMIDNKITFKEAEALYKNSYSGIIVNNRFSLLNDPISYDNQFPSLPVNRLGNNASNKKPPAQRFTAISQPLPSTSNNNHNFKKRKQNFSPSPQAQPMFPFVFGSSTPLTPMGNNKETSDEFTEIGTLLINTLTEYFVNLVKNCNSLDDIRKINFENIKSKLSDIISERKPPLNWKDYLRNDENKTELYAFLSAELLSLLQDIRIITNVGSEIKSSVSLGSFLRDISLQGLEEADGRIILHAMDIACGSARRIVIRSSDTDVLVLAVSFIRELHKKKGLKELWVLFGVGKDRRYVAAHDVASTLGEKKATTLRFFYCLTGVTLPTIPEETQEDVDGDLQGQV